MENEKTLRKIKKVALFLVLFFTATAILGIGLKLLNISGGSIAFVISITSLATIFWPFAIFFVWHNEFKQQQILLSLGYGLTASILLVGILFTIQLWPNNMPMLLVGIILSLILTIVFAILRSSNNTYLNPYYKSMFKRSIIILIVGVAVYIVPVHKIHNAPDQDTEHTGVLYLPE